MDPLSRRTLLGQTVGGAVTLAFGPLLKNTRLGIVANAVGVTNPLSGAALQEDVVTYVGFGEHRTATAVDVSTANWLERQLQAAGFATEQQSFNVSQSFVNQAQLLAGSAGDTAVTTFPLWPVTFTPQPIVRPLADLRTASPDPNDRIALISLPYDSEATITADLTSQILSAADAGAVAVIVVTAGPSNQLIEQNLSSDAQVWPIPVLLVGPGDVAALTSALSANANVTVSITGHNDEAATAANVIGRLERQSGAPWVVISTPYSGWFHCGGERGPGIAVWLGISRWIASQAMASTWQISQSSQQPLNYLFVATSGHELAGAGISAFLNEEAPPPEDVSAWFHFGAWAASYNWLPARGKLPPLRLGTPNSRYLVEPLDAFGTLRPLLSLPKLIPSFGTPLGDIVEIWDAGYPHAIGITGGNVPHHTPGDTSQNTGPDQLQPLAQAVSQYLIEIGAA